METITALKSTLHVMYEYNENLGQVIFSPLPKTLTQLQTFWGSMEQNATDTDATVTDELPETAHLLQSYPVTAIQ